MMKPDSLRYKALVDLLSFAKTKYEIEVPGWGE